MKILSTVILACFLASFWAQKSNVTDAHNALKKYVPLMGDMESNKKALSSAKAAIDLAAVNTETANALDMHKYRGKIYYGLMECAMVEAAVKGKEPDTAQISSYERVVKQSFSTILNAPKAKSEKDEIKEFINQKTGFYFNTGLSLFTAKNYPEATMMFMTAFEIAKLVNETYEDASTNTKLSFVRSIDTLIFQKKFAQADSLGKMVYETMPKDIDILISLINLNLQKNDMASTEKFLNEATTMDPTNKSLFVVLGTSLMELKQNDRAEAAFLKALTIDPLYPESVYQYCTFMFNWSRDLSNSASELKPKDPNIPKIEKQASEIMNRIPRYLDAFLEKNPSDKTGLDIGWKVYYMLGDEAKSADLKKRWEAIK